jgi:hypothetical protein
MKCCLRDPDGYDLTLRDQCTGEIPELVAAVDCWLRKRKNRKGGRQFKCTIASGEKTILSRVSSRIETFVGHTLIERTMECTAAAWHMIIQRSKILPFPLIKHRRRRQGCRSGARARLGSHTCRGGHGGISRIPGELDPAEPMSHMQVERFSTKWVL